MTGVETDAGPIAAGAVLSAVGGRVTQLAAMAGVRLPIRPPPAGLVTNAYARVRAIVSDTELLFYVSQTARGQMLMGAEFDPSPATPWHVFEFLQSLSPQGDPHPPVPPRPPRPAAVDRICDISPDYSPIMGPTVDGFLVTTGWGTWGFKAIPAGGEAMAELIATGAMPSLIAPFGLDRFAREPRHGRPGSAGTR